MARTNFTKDEFYPFYEVTLTDMGDAEVEVPEDFLDEFQQVMLRFELMQSKLDDLVNGITDDAHTEDASLCWCKPTAINENGKETRWEHRR